MKVSKTDGKSTTITGANLTKLASVPIGEAGIYEVTAVVSSSPAVAGVPVLLTVDEGATGEDNAGDQMPLPAPLAPVVLTIIVEAHDTVSLWSTTNGTYNVGLAVRKLGCRCGHGGK